MNSGSYERRTHDGKPAEGREGQGGRQGVFASGAWGRLRPWRWPLGCGVALALPLYAMSLAGPIGRAEGCSGGPQNFESWAGLAPVAESGIPVNGAFVVRGISLADEASALTGLSARVTDAAGAEVPGALSLVYLEPTLAAPFLGWSGDNRGNVAWRPQAPFAPSAQYTMHVEVARIYGGSPVLYTWSFQTAAAAAAPVVAPQGAQATFTFGTLLGGREGHCFSGGASCGNGRFPSQETPTQSLLVRFQPGLDPAMLPLATYTVETYVPGGPGQVLATLRRNLDDASPLEAVVHFDAPADQYCVRVRATSALGGEAEVGPLCAAHDPGAGATSSLDAALLRCFSAPIETDLCLRYCELRPENCSGGAGAAGGPAQCFPYVPPPGGGGGSAGAGASGAGVGDSGTGGFAGTPGGSGTGGFAGTSSSPGAPGQGDARGDAGAMPLSDDVESCAMPRVPARSTLGSGLALALALAGLGRRCRRGRA